MRPFKSCTAMAALMAVLSTPALGQGGSGSSRVEPVMAHEQAMETMGRVQKMLDGLQEKLDSLAAQPADPKIEKKLARLRRNMETYSVRLAELEKEMGTTYRNLMSDADAEVAQAVDSKVAPEAPTCPSNCNCSRRKADD